MSVFVVSVCWGRQFHDYSNTIEEIKVPDSGRSVVARLKLEGIDGRAPPGVESAALFVTTREKLTRS